ncbi:putative glutamine--tRNA ligase [Helianthus annuus]|uniref:Glutamine--tRNA ligase n=1 Tax=Helianthus annuus TaxID=4232 RepID=A0A9K3NBV9_HELAN|nr:putative glutamine--tRNA ligase [Helianthus annuus]
MFVDTGLAKERGGGYYLITTPHVSLKAVFLSTKIEITYTSDYFQELYDLAVEFIRRGCELVDHQVLHWVVPKLYYTHCIVDSLEIITHLVKFNGTCFHIFILLLIIYC